MMYALPMTTVDTALNSTAPILTKGAVQTAVTTGNMPVRDSVKMSFDADSLPHIMQSLTNLYADPYLAILREYTMNARDSHVAANQKAPIQVTLPSRFEPTFIVQDQGVGMSQFEILDIYSKYGRSTKRDDMTQVGAFGLGSKCALSLVDQFSIIAVKDGERTIAIVSKTADGGGEVNIISAEETTESNGVRVVVAIPNYERFNRNAEKFFLTWQKGTVAVGGKEPANIYGDDFVHYGRFHVKPEAPAHIKRSIFLVIGGVSYEISDLQYLPAVKRGFIAYTAYIEVPIGAVDFTPARDTLRYTTRTREQVYKSVEEIEEKFSSIAQQDLNAQEDRDGAVAARLRWTARGYPDAFELTWRGESIPLHLYSHLVEDKDSEKKELLPANMDRHSIGTTSRNSSVTASRTIPLDEGDSQYPCIIVTGHVLVSEVRLKAALRDISFDNGQDLDRAANYRIIYILNKEGVKFSSWITETNLFQVIDIQDVLERSTEIRRSRRRAAAANRAPGESVEAVKDANFSYEVCIVGKKGSPAKETRMTVKEIPLNSYYVDSHISQVMTAAKSRYGSRRSVTWFADFDEGDHIILLPRGRMDSALFRRLGKLHGSEVSLTSVSQKIARDVALVSRQLDNPVSIYFAARASEGYSFASSIFVIMEMISADNSMRKLFPEFVCATDFKKEAELHPHAFKNVVQVFNSNNDVRKHRGEAEAIINKYVAKYPLIGGITMHGATSKEVLIKEMIRYIKTLQKVARDTVTSNTKER